MTRIKIYFILSIIVILLFSCERIDERADKLWNNMNFQEAVELYERSVEEGSAYAKWRLSNAYASGRGVPRDELKAFALIEESAKEGCEEAMCDYGLAYLHGEYGIEENVDKGKRILEELWSKTDNSYCLSKYAQELISGETYEQDLERAWNILGNVKDKNNGCYLRNMAWIYTQGTTTIDMNWQKSVELCEKAFQKGEFHMAQPIGAIYRSGIGNVEKNIEKSVEWFNKGAKCKDTFCMNEMAGIYLSNDSIYNKWHNPLKGIEMYERSAKLGSGNAYLSLGNLYYSGDEVSKDDNKAFKYYEKAARLHSPSGKNNLGSFYYDGIGCDKDVNKAMCLYTEAAELGSGRACYNLYKNFYGLLDNDLIDIDLNKSKEYLLKAVELEDIYAIIEIGNHYYSGSEIFEENKYQAFLYYKKAADMGNIDVCSRLSYMCENGIGTDMNPKMAKKYKDRTIVDT